MHYSPSRRNEDLRWDFTLFTGRCYMAVGYCQGWRDWSEEEREELGYPEGYFERLEAHKDKFHEDGHETPEEAFECYRQYLLDVELDLDGFMPDTMKRCEVCQEFTQGFAGVGSFKVVLCDRHRTPERFETKFDFDEFID